MSDDRLELPLFDRPELDRPGSGPLEDGTSIDEVETHPLDVLDTLDGAEAGHESEVPETAEGSIDEPVVIETLELPDHQGNEESVSMSAPQPAGIGARLAAGLIDLVVHIALGGVLIGGSALLGAPIGWRHVVPLALAAGIISFVYHVIPLAFWGRTPGMAVAGLRARTLDDRPLSLPQATKHWLALILTTATAGLGVLLALGGRSLADRLSGSQTLLE